MDWNLNQFLLAISSALDYVEIGILGASTNHSKRVAYTSLRLAEYLELSAESRFDLCSLAVLHDNGLSEEALHSVGNSDSAPERLKLVERYHIHCEIGERNVRDFPFLTNPVDVVRYHHERYDGSGFYGVEREAIPPMAQIIGLADAADNLFQLDESHVANRLRIEQYVSTGRGTLFAPELVDAFLDLSRQLAFWLDLREPFIHRALARQLPQYSAELSLSEVFSVTDVLSRIVDAKSRFTFTHSAEVAEKAGWMADHYGFRPEHKWKLLIAASLHDLGKLAVPNAILDKPGPLTAAEFEQIKAHSYYTEMALNQIDDFDEITRWAARHHEKLDGSGYHAGLKGDELGLEERLLAVLDIYQALTEDRPYRRSMTHDEAMGVLVSEGKKGTLDRQVIDDIDTVLGTAERSAAG